MRFFICLALPLFLFAGNAQAKWFEASTPHFVIYANDSEKDLRNFSDNLERYHAAMARLTGDDSPRPSPSNRVTIFVADSERDVRRLSGMDNPYVLGFYVPRAGSSVAYISKIHFGGKKVDMSMVTLLHEYAHHFSISKSNFSMPRWVMEGSAEFFASAIFYGSGEIGIGRPAHHRAYELSYSSRVTAEELLDPDIFDQKEGSGYTEFYGKSWLLYHYLQFSEDRQGQLDAYIRALANGKTQREAALAVFGDFETLDNDLEIYLKKKSMRYLRLPADWFPPSDIDIRALTEGEVEMMPLRMRSNRGVDREQAAEIVIEARAVADRFPDNAHVQAALAEAEFDAGNNDAAIAAADAALRIDPAQVNAYVQKGYALFSQADEVKDSEARAAAYQEARAPFLALNKIENDHPLPLVYFYRSYREQGGEVPDLAYDALNRAVDLARFDQGLRMMLAMELMARGDMDRARWHLTLLASDPHGSSVAQAAKEQLAQMNDTDPLQAEDAAVSGEEPAPSP